MGFFYGNGANNTFYGTAGTDYMYGNGGDDILSGGGGSDWLYGGDGNDQLSGGTGADTMIGGAGNDSYSVIYDNTDTIIENADEGYDTVYAWMDYQLGNNVENLGMQGTAIHGFGNGLNNNMWGNASTNYIWGFDGNDWLHGGGGNDTLYGGIGSDLLWGDAGTDTLVGGTGNDYYEIDTANDVVTENANEGFDTVYSTVTYGLAANVEKLDLLDEGGSINGYGNGLDNSIWGNSSDNTLYGFDGVDNLYGFGGTDTMYGGDGHDYLWEQGSAATMYGGAGDDSYWIDGNDTVIEYASPGFGDWVTAQNMSYTLGANVENLALAEGGAFSGAGNELHNTIKGNSDTNQLYGYSGNDILTGNGGADTFVFTGLNEADKILDFSTAQGDLISLEVLDAIMGGGDDAFSYIDGAFTGVAGQLHFLNGLVEGDVDGDGAADFAIEVNQASLAATDFIL